MLTVTVLAGGMAQAGKPLYKWVDKKGNIHYSDRVPPRDAGQRRDVINKRGITVKTIEAAKTRKQLEAERRRKAALAKKRKAVERKRAHDRMLLDTYVSVKDIIKARDAKLESLRNLIRITDNTVVKLEHQLSGLRARAANAERAGKPISPQLVRNISSLEKQIADNKKYILKQRREEREIRRRYERYIMRFKELKGLE
jgi:hypothetical protein